MFRFTRLTLILIGFFCSSVCPQNQTKPKRDARQLLDASDNNLTSIEELSRLKLVELRVPVNSLQQINSFEGAFSHLKVLDVSFNLLSAQAMAELSTLPQLTKLDISGNNVGALPLFGSDGAFPRLQVLIAERADLASQDLLCLQHLPRVKELRLSSSSAIILFCLGIV